MHFNPVILLSILPFANILLCSFEGSFPGLSIRSSLISVAIIRWEVWFSIPSLTSLKLLLLRAWLQPRVCLPPNIHLWCSTSLYPPTTQTPAEQTHSPHWSYITYSKRSSLSLSNGRSTKETNADAFRWSEEKKKRKGQSKSQHWPSFSLLECFYRNNGMYNPKSEKVGTVYVDLESTWKLSFGKIYLTLISPQPPREVSCLTVLKPNLSVKQQIGISAGPAWASLLDNSRWGCSIQVRPQIRRDNPLNFTFIPDIYIYISVIEISRSFSSNYTEQ